MSHTVKHPGPPAWGFTPSPANPLGYAPALPVEVPMHPPRLAAVWLLCACTPLAEDPATNPVDDRRDALEAYCPSQADTIEARLDELLADLTLEEKVTLMAGTGAAVDGLWPAPGVERLGIPPVRMVDGPRGVSAAVGPATAFPVGIARGATWDVALEREVGAAMGREARAAGAEVLLAPTVNVLRHPLWGRAQETYGEDPHHLAELGIAFVDGAQQHVMASVKHFAVNSIEDTRFEVSVALDERTLREVYLPAFRRVVSEAHVASVMSAYNRVRGTYAAENDHLLHTILKDEWNFQGFVESDWVFGTRSTSPSLAAGLDLEMPGPNHYGGPLLDLAATDADAEPRIDLAVRRLLRARFCFDVDTAPAVADPAARETPEHLALAQQVAERAAVLLVDQDALPLSPTARLGLVGALHDADNHGDTGSSDVAPSDVVTVLEGLTPRVDDLVVLGDTLDPEEHDTLDTLDAVIAVVGLTADDEGESLIGAGDREGTGLSDADVALITALTARHDRVVVVMQGGSAIDVSGWVDGVEGLVMAWYPGSQGGHAIARLLLGEVGFSGRLPVSFAADDAHLPPWDNTSLTVTYDRWHGHQHLARQGTPARFPFGFGLSSTTFSWDDATLDGDTVRATVSNTGQTAGIETVQVWASAPDSALDRPDRWLVGFAPIALDPGETGTVDIPVPDARLRHWTDDGWALEDTPFTLFVARHAEDPGHPLPR